MSLSKPPRDVELKIIREKHQQIPEILHEHDIECWIVFIRETAATPDPVQPLVLGGDVVWQSAFIFSLKNKVFTKTAIVGNYDAPEEKNKGLWDKVIAYKEGISAPLKEYILALGPKNIALNYSIDDVTSDGITHGMFLTISEILENYTQKFVSAAPIIQALRGRKSKTEIDLVTKACELTEDIYERIGSQVKIGMSETEIQQMFHNEMDRLGVTEAWHRGHCPAVDTGPDKEIGHAGPLPDNKVKYGHTLHYDFGIKRYGYCSDIQRMYFFGSREDIPEELHHAFNTVYHAITLAAEYIKPGVPGYKVDKVARDYVKEQGYEEYGHALGHQVGTQAHDGGTLLGPLWERYGDIPKGKVEQNQIFTLELHVNTENYGAVSLEEDIVITEDGCRFLVPRQKEFITIEK
ncbi:MAG: M24 family metallopeptidase [Asgard group archaeon]|nr:M24 family metallopeptidase [Asgard group archaeon]